MQKAGGKQPSAFKSCVAESKEKVYSTRIGSSLLATIVYFLVLLSLKAMLICALVHTVSAQSKSVDGQRCGHRANYAKQGALKSTASTHERCCVGKRY